MDVDKLSFNESACFFLLISFLFYGWGNDNPLSSLRVSQDVWNQNAEPAPLSLSMLLCMHKFRWMQEEGRVHITVLPALPLSLEKPGHFPAEKGGPFLFLYDLLERRLFPVLAWYLLITVKLQNDVYNTYQLCKPPKKPWLILLTKVRSWPRKGNLAASQDWEPLCSVFVVSQDW